MFNTVTALLKKKTILICTLIGIIILFILFFFSMHRKTGIQIPPALLSPTPIPISFSVTSFSPSGNTTNIGVSVKFSRPLSNSEQKQITVDAQPSISFTPSWSPDGQMLSLQPNVSVNPDQTYTITITSPAGPSSWNVSGAQLNDLYAKQQQIQQSQADQAFGQRDQQIINTYPWFSEFPILTNEYFLYFDIQQKQFIAKLYPDTTSQIPYDTQIDTFKSEVLQKLHELNIDTTQYPVSWVIVPNGGK